MEIEESMSLEETTTRLVLAKTDLVLLAEMESKVNKGLSKFTFQALTPENLNYVAWESNQIARQVTQGHKFFNIEDNCFYSFKYMKIHVDKINQSIEVKPCFVKEGKLFDNIKGDKPSRQ